MTPPSLISRVVNPVVDFFKTVPATIRDGISEVADALSPFRKRPRPADVADDDQFSNPSGPAAPSGELQDNAPLNPHPKRLRFSDASASNAAGSSVPTPSAFRPAPDLLAATLPAHGLSQAVARVPRLPVQYHPPHYQRTFHQPFSEPVSFRREPSLALQPPQELDVRNVFDYPVAPRRASSSGLRDLWSSGRERYSVRRRSLTGNGKLSAARQYWESVEERHRSATPVAYHSTSRVSSRRFTSLRSPSPPVPPAPTESRPNAEVAQRKQERASSRTHNTPGRPWRPSPYIDGLPLRVTMKKKRYQSEERVRRSNQASVKKLSASEGINEPHASDNHMERDDDDAAASNFPASRENVPLPFVDLIGTDSILGQKLAKMHGAAINRLVKSQNRSRHRQLECWLAEQDLKQIQRKREETKRLLALESRTWIREEARPEAPPKHAEFFDEVYWEGGDDDWEEELDDDAVTERQKQVTVQEPNAVFSPITSAALQRLRATFTDDSNYYVQLAKIDGCVIHGEDLRRLKPNCWLNDEIVNAYMALLTARLQRVKERSKESSSLGSESAGNIKIMNSFFYTRLVQFNKMLSQNEYNYARVRRWTRRFDAFSFDTMLVPINEQNMHWTLGVINFRDKTVEHLDSMGTGGSPAVREFLLRWVRDEAEDKQKPFDPKGWKSVERRVPMQENSDDCGVFMCKYADFICRGWKNFTFSQRHMNFFRGRIAHELLMGKA